ncbi:integrase [Nocardia sp. 852002-20019_SCH5090214]|uniref:tyrosine-type recombinase/integrase n=1 Tax=Nocardia sp. 852002-20019_SCH5090214 TaxID=1834087 RepID=UPI0007EA6E45|nr:site-specific integrase [Nocardia sp. 852002-20019_SCH5090214]OBA48815.1 integrase [Nocardia sp. 852002-20019_SCH5090214]
MPRQRMAPGEWGKISVTQTGPEKFTASTYVRDQDGKRRQVERSGRSEEDARRNLQRHLKTRTSPSASTVITERTTLAELFALWIASKEKAGLKGQSVDKYQRAWDKHGVKQIGELRVREFPTSRAESHLGIVAESAASQAKFLRVALTGMFAMAVRHDVLAVNPLRETSRDTRKKTPVRALTVDEFARVRAAVLAYTKREHVSGPPPGRLLPPFVDVMGSTGCRPNEVLGLRWSDVDLLSDPPVMTVAGTMIDHGKVKGQSLRRQDSRKGDAPDHTVVLPALAVQALAKLLGEASKDLESLETLADKPVFPNRDGGWMSLNNLRRSLRAALPEDLKWITPYSLRRTVGTVIRDGLGVEQAQAQLSHAQLATTEHHYVERRTHGPDVREVLDRYAKESTDPNVRGK